MDDATQDIDVTIDAESGGVWWVHTASGAVHVWNLDDGTVTRAQMDENAEMRWDGQALRIVSILEYPRIGHPFAVVLAHPGSGDMVAIRSSSEVVAVRRSAKRSARGRG